MASKTEKKPFEIERELAQARADYHEASQTESEPQLRERSDNIKKLSDELNERYVRGAIAPDGVTLVGIKKGKGLYEIGDSNGLRSQGETPDEAAQNWNDGVFVEFTGPGATVGKAEE